VERLNLKKLNDVEVKGQYQVIISNRYAALGNLVVVVMWTSVELGKIPDRL
jgi:hypothetical protein